MKKTIAHYQKRVLLVDAGFSAIPLLNFLKEDGYHVGVCGSKKEDPCHQLADESYIVDYSSLSLLENIYNKHNYSYLVPGCTDISYLSCASIGEKLNIPGFDKATSTIKIFNKGEFRELCHSLSIPSPRFFNDKYLADTLRFPILQKPTNSFSGKGIQRFNNKKDFVNQREQNQTATSPNSLVYEEYVKGSLYSHSAFIKNGEINYDFFVIEYSTVNPYQVNSSHLDTKLRLTIKNKVRNAIFKIASSLNLVDGLVHTQFISNGSEFWLIEMTRRCPGDLYSLLINYSTGIDYPRLYVEPYLNKKKDLYNVEHPSSKKYFSRHTLSTTTHKIFTGITCDTSCKKSIIFNLKNLGSNVDPAPYDRAAVLFFEYRNESEMRKKTPNLYKKIKME